MKILKVIVLLLLIQQLLFSLDLNKIEPNPNKVLASDRPMELVNQYKKDCVKVVLRNIYKYWFINGLGEIKKGYLSFIPKSNYSVIFIDLPVLNDKKEFFVLLNELEKLYKEDPFSFAELCLDYQNTSIGHATLIESIKKINDKQFLLRIASWGDSYVLLLDFDKIEQKKYYFSAKFVAGDDSIFDLIYQRRGTKKPNLAFVRISYVCSIIPKENFEMNRKKIPDISTELAAKYRNEGIQKKVEIVEQLINTHKILPIFKLSLLFNYGRFSESIKR